VEIGGHPAADTTVIITRYGGDDGDLFTREVETDHAGEFKVVDLPPGKYRVSRLVSWVSETKKFSTTTATGSHGVRVEVKPRETTRVTLASPGRKVRGRLVPGDRRLPELYTTS
jgi:hypothetical protein